MNRAMADALVEAVRGSIRTHRLDDGRLQLVAHRPVRPLTFNASRVKPAFGKAGAKQMAAGAFRVQDEIDSWRVWAAEHRDLTHIHTMHGQVVVDVHHERINGSGMPDTGSPYIALKALLDGLADAKALPRGDGPSIVRRLTFHPPEVVGHDGLRVVITTLPGTEQTALDLSSEGAPTP